MSTTKTRAISVRVSHELLYLVEMLRGTLSLSEYITQLIERDYDEAVLFGKINIKDKI